MLNRIAKPALIGATSFLVLLTGAAANADYRVTAFGYTAGFQALLNMDVDAALTRLEGGAHLDFAEANNLCVAKILAEDLGGAVSDCEMALSKLDTAMELSATKKKKAMASIYSNLGVAEALSGDLDSASNYLEKALELNASDKNAVNNFESVQAGAVAAI